MTIRRFLELLVREMRLFRFRRRPRHYRTLIKPGPATCRRSFSRN